MMNNENQFCVDEHSLLPSTTLGYLPLSEYSSASSDESNLLRYLILHSNIPCLLAHFGLATPSSQCRHAVLEPPGVSNACRILSS